MDLGWFLPDREHSLSAGGTAGIGDLPEIDFFQEFGVEKQDTLFAAELDWRFHPRWSFRAQYFKSSGETRATLSNDIEWEDIIFLAGSSVAIGSEFQMTRLFFGRSFLSQPHHDFGVGGGVHWLTIRAFVEGTVLQPGGSQETRREATSVEGPMPTIGVWYNRSLSPNWVFTTRFDYMSASVSKYDGRYINAAVGINYAVNERFGIGTSYNYIGLDVGVSDENWRGVVDIDYQGFYLNASFFWR